MIRLSIPWTSAAEECVIRGTRFGKNFRQVWVEVMEYADGHELPPNFKADMEALHKRYSEINHVLFPDTYENADLCGLSPPAP